MPGPESAIIGGMCGDPIGGRTQTEEGGRRGGGAQEVELFTILPTGHGHGPWHIANRLKGGGRGRCWPGYDICSRRSECAGPRF